MQILPNFVKMLFLGFPCLNNHILKKVEKSESPKNLTLGEMWAQKILVPKNLSPETDSGKIEVDVCLKWKEWKEWKNSEKNSTRTRWKDGVNNLILNPFEMTNGDSWLAELDPLEDSFSGKKARLALEISYWLKLAWLAG